MARSVISLYWHNNILRFSDFPSALLLHDRSSIDLIVVFRDFLSCFLWPCIFLHTIFIRGGVGDDVLDFSGLLNVLATLDAVFWIMSVTVSLMLSTSSNYCSARINSS